MNKKIQRMAGLVAVSLFAATGALAQINYATPYTIFTIAGTAGIPGSHNGLNGAGMFAYPSDLVADTNNNLYVVDDEANTVVEVSPAGGTNWLVTTIAGTGAEGYQDGAGLTTATFSGPTGIAIDVANNLYVADYGNCLIRKVAKSGNNWSVVTIAGTGAFPPTAGSNDGTNGAAQFQYPSGIAVDTASNLYVADTYGCTIRKISPIGTNWVVTTIAGTANVIGSQDGTNQAAAFYYPQGIAVDGSGNLFVADTDNSTIREIVPVGTNWVVSTIAGTVNDFENVDGTNTASSFNAPQGIAVDANDNLYVADTGDNTIRKITPVGTNWVTTTLAGSPNADTPYTNGIGSAAAFNLPGGVVPTSSGNIFIADSDNFVIREGVIAALPNLTIGTDGNGNVVVSWPGSFGVVQTNSDLTTSNWAAYGGAISNSNGTNSVTIAPASTALYFRLTN